MAEYANILWAICGRQVVADDVISSIDMNTVRRYLRINCEVAYCSMSFVLCIADDKSRWNVIIPHVSVGIRNAKNDAWTSWDFGKFANPSRFWRSRKTFCFTPAEVAAADKGERIKGVSLAKLPQRICRSLYTPIRRSQYLARMAWGSWSLCTARKTSFHVNISSCFVTMSTTVLFWPWHNNTRRERSRSSRKSLVKDHMQQQWNSIFETVLNMKIVYNVNLLKNTLFGGQNNDF